MINRPLCSVYELNAEPGVAPKPNTKETRIRLNRERFDRLCQLTDDSGFLSEVTGK